MFGTLIAIPPTVAVNSLGLTPSGIVLARALQDYGAYCDDSTGTENLIIDAEDAADGMPELQEMRADIVKIRTFLRPVLNNTPATPGGGGTPRAPLAPPLRPPPA